MKTKTLFDLLLETKNYGICELQESIYHHVYACYYPIKDHDIMDWLNKNMLTKFIDIDAVIDCYTRHLVRYGFVG